MRIFSRQKGADILGISSSILCIIHCLAFPLLLVAGNFTDHWHRWDSIDYVFVLMAGVAVFFSTRRLSNPFIQSGLWISWVGFSVAILLHDRYIGAQYTSLIASLLLTFFHIASYRERHSQCPQ